MSQAYSGGGGGCNCCGRPSHIARNCRHAHKTCDTCGRVVHLKSQCVQRQAKPGQIVQALGPKGGGTGNAKGHEARDKGDKGARTRAWEGRKTNDELEAEQVTWVCGDCVKDNHDPHATKCQHCKTKRTKEEVDKGLLNKELREYMEQSAEESEEEDSEAIDLDDGVPGNTWEEDVEDE